MTCQPDNVAEFNQALKTHLPGAHDLIKALMDRGMMQGLRGVTLAPVGTLPAGVQPVWGIHTSVAENLQITTLFTVVSITRGYLWRRAFNAIARSHA